MVVAEPNRGHSLLQSGRWAEARAAFEAALEQEETPEDLSGLATALLWCGELMPSIQCHQRAYNASRAVGDGIAATFSALTVSILYNCYLGNESAARGWLSRAETAAHTVDPLPVQGYLWSFKGYVAMDRDLQLSEDLQRRALGHARATSDRDLELIAMASLGALLTRAGRVQEGLSFVDEAMAALSAEEYSRIDTVVIVCCAMLMACEAGADLRRAKEWCSIADQFHERYGCPFLFGECRSIYGRLLMMLGRWPAAERQLRTAIEATREAFPPVFLGAVASLAELKVKQGRLEEADALLKGLEYEVRPALALASVRMAQHRPDAAAQLLERAMRRLDSRTIASIQALERLVEARLMADDSEGAANALAELQEITRDSSWPEARARAAMATGRVKAFVDDVDAAIEQYEEAVACFSQLGMPYEMASARLALASVGQGQYRELAISEAEGALDTFERLGAQPGSDAASALLRALGHGTRPGPRTQGLLTIREQEVLSLLRSGLSNPEIADRLVISRKTAAHHVSSLLAKLGVRNRAEAVAFASRPAVEA